MPVRIALEIVLAAMAAAPTTQPATTRPAVIDEPPRVIRTLEQQRADAVRVISRFVSHVETDGSIDASARDAIAKAWQQHREDEDPREFLTAGIAILSPDYKSAMGALEEQDYETADARLAAAAGSKDPYVSLHAAALQARSLVEQEKLEEAEKILAPLAAREQDLIDRTFLEAEVDFLLGYAQLSNLKYEDALASLQRFERQHPDAPDKFRLPARQMLQELRVRQPEGLGEVSDLMVYAGRRLASGEPGKPVRMSQDRAVVLLTKLIEEAEQREQQQKQSSGCKKCGGKGCQECPKSGPPAGVQQPNAPANISALPGGKGEIGKLHPSARARPGQEWGNMRPEERERILQSLRRDFPSQYRQLVEQYYRQLAKEQ